MNIPTATYRIQFNSAFGFQAAQLVISYLADLGISDLYASPIFKTPRSASSLASLRASSFNCVRVLSPWSPFRMALSVIVASTY
jgi:hypothetical protein